MLPITLNGRRSVRLLVISFLVISLGGEGCSPPTRAPRRATREEDLSEVSRSERRPRKPGRMPPTVEVEAPEPEPEAAPGGEPAATPSQAAAVPPPGVTEVAGRALVLRALLAALVYPRAGEQVTEASREKFESERQGLVEWLKQEGAWRHARREERAVLEAPVGTAPRRKRNDAAALRETLMVLLWALGGVEALPDYDTPAPSLARLARAMPDVGAPAGAFMKRTRLRPGEEIELALEAAEFWRARARATEAIARSEFPPAEELDELIGDLRSRAAVIGFKLGPMRDGRTFFRELIRFTAHYAHHVRGLIPPPVGEDFPALGKKYADLTGAEFMSIQAIAVPRHQALTWLAGLPDEWR